MEIYSTLRKRHPNYRECGLSNSKNINFWRYHFNRFTENSMISAQFKLQSRIYCLGLARVDTDTPQRPNQNGTTQAVGNNGTT